MSATEFVSERLPKSVGATAKKAAPLFLPLVCNSNKTDWYEAKCNWSLTTQTWLVLDYQVMTVEVIESKRCCRLVWAISYFTGRILLAAALFNRAEEIIRILCSDIRQRWTHHLPHIVIILAVIVIDLKHRKF